MSNRTTQSAVPIAGHGLSELASVHVDAYNAELRDAEGFLGDRASKRAFHDILDDWRERATGDEEDPLGDEPSRELGKKKLDKVLVSGDPEAAGLVHAAIEDFATEFSTVIRRFLRLKSWARTERIVIGGGFREGRVGELALGRTAILLKAEDIDIDLVPIRHDPDEAGLIGAVHLAPSWIFGGYDSILAVDIGGTNMRAGVVALGKKSDLSGASIALHEQWRHRDEKPTREEAVQELIEMLDKLVRDAGKEKLRLAPFIGIGCPGMIREDGSISRGGQNLPGNWSAKGFNLPERVIEGVAPIDDHKPVVLMHNDAVVQGLSQRPFMTDVERWGVMTIGTGLGNARFTNREPE